MATQLMAVPWEQIPTWVIVIVVITIMVLSGFTAALIWDFVEGITVVKALRKGGFLIRRDLHQGDPA